MTDNEWHILATYLRRVYMGSELNTQRIFEAEANGDTKMFVRLLEEQRRVVNRYIRILKKKE